MAGGRPGGRDERQGRARATLRRARWHAQHRSCGELPRRAAQARARTTLGAALAAAAVLLVLPAAAQALEQKLTASAGTAGDRFGDSVAIDGDTAVVGAPRADGGGALYVFKRTGDSWTQTAKLTTSDGAANDRLGASVAIDGNLIVAGASGDDLGANAGEGSVYTFTRTGAPTRTQTAKLTASGGAATDALGTSVAIDGDVIVAGAPGDEVGINPAQGSAYTFASTGAAARSETAKLTASDGFVGDNLGHSVAIDGDTIVAGAPFDDIGDPDQGSAYTFDRTGAAARTETAKLTASFGTNDDNLGFSVAIDGDLIVAGKPDDLIHHGAAYTFARTGAGWTPSETAQLNASDGVADDELGASVAIDGAAIVAGAGLHDAGGSSDQGAAYTFARTGAAVRTETAKLVDSEGAAGEQFGLSVAIDGAAVLAGAPFDDVDANADEGSASIFFPPAPPPPGGGGGGGGGAGAPPALAVVPCPEGTSPTVTCTRDPDGRLRYQGTDADEAFAGSKGDDVMAGEGGRDEMNARAGEDELRGGAGNDALKGNGGRDRLSGQGGRDRLKGGGGRDRLRGGKGKDSLSGQGGKDRLKGNGGRDRFSGGGGNDKINSKGQRREKVGCGGGKKDRVTHAKGDRVRRSCERVKR